MAVVMPRDAVRSATVQPALESRCAWRIGRVPPILVLHLGGEIANAAGGEPRTGVSGGLEFRFQ